MVKASKAAIRLGVSQRTIVRAVARKQIPGTRVGNLTLVNGAWLTQVTSWPPSVEAAAS
jgi:excisionase family DNA binding protein